MGLDATWYRGLERLVGIVLDADGEPVGVEGKYVKAYVNPDFPGRNGGVEDRAVYRYAAAGEAFGGAYSAYNGWRDWLAKLAGYPEAEYDNYGTSLKSYAAAAWQGIVSEDAPFWGLVNFSDCEGVIGSEACAKLAKDFAEFDEKAKADPGGRGVRGATYYEVYRQWRHAFEQASDNGCVTFH